MKPKFWVLNSLSKYPIRWSHSIRSRCSAWSRWTDCWWREWLSLRSGAGGDGATIHKGSLVLGLTKVNGCRWKLKMILFCIEMNRGLLRFSFRLAFSLDLHPSPATTYSFWRWETAYNFQGMEVTKPQQSPQNCVGGFQVCFFDPYKGSCSAIDLDIFLRAGSTTRKKQPLIAGLERCPDCGRRKVLPHHLPNQHVTGLFCFFLKNKHMPETETMAISYQNPGSPLKWSRQLGTRGWCVEAMKQFRWWQCKRTMMTSNRLHLENWGTGIIYHYICICIYIYIYLALAHRCFTQQRPSNSEFLCQHCMYVYLLFIYLCINQLYIFLFIYLSIYLFIYLCIYRVSSLLACNLPWRYELQYASRNPTDLPTNMWSLNKRNPISYF